MTILESFLLILYIIVMGMVAAMVIASNGPSLKEMTDDEQDIHTDSSI